MTGLSGFSMMAVILSGKIGYNTLYKTENSECWVDILLDLDFNLNEFCGKTDEELVMLAKSDRSAEDALVLRFSQLIFIKAEIFSSHVSDTDDLRQEGLMGLLKAIASFDIERGVKFSTYAEVCIVNRMKTYAVKCGVDPDQWQSLEELPEDAASLEETPESIYINKEFFSELWHAVDNVLSQSERQVFSLCIQGLGYRQTAAMLGVSVKSVDNAMHRARKKIRSYINKNQR